MSGRSAADLFLVLKGRLAIEMRDRTVHLGPGELFAVPTGVEHRPVARIADFDRVLFASGQIPEIADRSMPADSRPQPNHNT